MGNTPLGCDPVPFLGDEPAASVGMGRDYLSYDGDISFSDGATTKCYEFIHGATI